MTLVDVKSYTRQSVWAAELHTAALFRLLENNCCSKPALFACSVLLYRMMHLIKTETLWSCFNISFNTVNGLA